MSVRLAIRQAIECIPNLLTSRAVDRFTRKAEHVTHSASQVADLIASVLPDGLKSQGFLIVKLPGLDIDEHGRQSIRVPVTAQPWSDGEVRISSRGDQVAIVNVPAGLPMQDVPALAAALMAAYVSTQERRPRRPAVTRRSQETLPGGRENINI